MQWSTQQTMRYFRSTSATRQLLQHLDILLAAAAFASALLLDDLMTTDFQFTPETIF
jgi:hypothetical protein